MSTLLPEAMSIVAAAAGSLCMIGWPMLPNRRAMLGAQLGLALSFALHYAIEGVQTAALLNLLGAAQVLATLAWGENPRMRWIGRAMIPAIVIAALASWSGPTSALSTIGMLLIALGRVQVDPHALRLIVLAGAPFWLAHDLAVGSPLALPDLIGLAVGVVMLLRDRRGPPPTRSADRRSPGGFAAALFQTRKARPSAGAGRRLGHPTA